MKRDERMAIWKFPLVVTDTQDIMMPGGAKILCLQQQGENGCIWAQCVTETPKQKRTFIHVGTGHPIPIDALNGEYIGSYQQLNGLLVWHVFEVI